MKKRNIAVISGGDSGEHEISIKSGREVSKAIDQERYNVYPLVIRGKDWYYKSPEHKKNFINKNDFSLTIEGERILFDVVFNAIHGTPGEDGKLQGYFDMLKIPYTSCNHEVSALTFHKGFCNQTVRSFALDDLKIADSILLVGDDLFDEKEIIDRIGLPCFVKAVKSGSSVGVYKAKKPEDIPITIEAAFEVCDEIMIEKFVKGRELTCGVSDFGKIIKTWPLAEIISKREFFDFTAKYDATLNQEIIPAPVSEELSRRIKNISKILYHKLRCEGIVRFDYIVTESEDIYFLEVNTVPGMTNESIVPKMVQSEGISLKDFYTMLIENALK
ncbi:MAG: D-alanine--D-alanine ligase [Bacteroidales bacterium]|jgi:D-alanine-D-alanine ligase|nr:D-alanine--D-alanine ligase [Bacteroidales bacterium]